MQLHTELARVSVAYEMYSAAKTDTQSLVNENKRFDEIGLGGAVPGTQTPKNGYAFRFQGIDLIQRTNSLLTSTEAERIKNEIDICTARETIQVV